MRGRRSKQRRARPTALNEVLQVVLQEAESEMDAGGARVAAAWAAVAGGELAEETRVSRFRRGVVYIEVASPPLCSELSQFRAMSLLQGMRAKLDDEPPVKELRFRLGTF